MYLGCLIYIITIIRRAGNLARQQPWLDKKRKPAISQAFFFYLTNSFNITDAGIQALVQCPQLQSLDLSWCYGIRNAAIILLAQGCPKLQSLNLSWCRKITDTAITALAQNCPQLQSLYLYSCNQITDAGITGFNQQRTALGLSPVTIRR